MSVLNKTNESSPLPISACNIGIEPSAGNTDGVCRKRIALSGIYRVSHRTRVAYRAVDVCVALSRHADRRFSELLAKPGK
jgi:hypothetical protein